MNGFQPLPRVQAIVPVSHIMHLYEFLPDEVANHLSSKREVERQLS